MEAAVGVRVHTKLPQIYIEFALACERLDHGEIKNLRIENGLPVFTSGSFSPVDMYYSPHLAVHLFAEAVGKIGDATVDVKVRQGVPVLLERVVTDFPFEAKAVVQKIDTETGTGRRRQESKRWRQT